MLKPPNQPRLSPASPRFGQYQYGTHSPHIATSTASRRVLDSSRPPSPLSVPAPPLRQVRYVSRGTQYSPIIRKMKDPPLPAPPVALAQQPTDEERAPIVVAAAPPPSAPVLNADSQSLKKRQTPEDISSALSIKPAVPAKRVRSAQGPVKVLPTHYEFCEVEDMVILIANMISELIETNDDLPLRSGVLTRFHSRTPPGISVMDYLQRLAKHATLTPPLLLSMVYYIDRLCSLYPAFTITTLTVHRFLITAATVAAKGLSDSFWNNATYARVGGIKIAELGLLELDFLYRVDWKIVPNPEVLVDYYKGLVERSEGYELESDNTSTDEEEEPDDDKGMVETSEVKADAETDMKWKEWMNDVSTQNAVKLEEQNDPILKES